MQWSTAMTMEIAGRGRIAYINRRKIEPNETNVAWDTWFLEENQVKTWIVNSMSPEIQPLILRNRTVRDMWVILEQMYGQKKRIVRVYQLMKGVYSLWQGEHSVADFYAALKSNSEDLDYYSDDTWDCPQGQVCHLTKEWENRVFLFLAGLNEDFEGIRSQILNSDKLPSIEEVYSRVEAEEQRRLIITGEKGDHISYNERSALVSRGPVGAVRPPRKCTHCKKTGHTMDFCWDLHPEKKNSRGKPSSGKKSTSNVANSSGEKAYISAEQIRDLRACLSQIDIGQAEAAHDVKVNHALAVSGEKGNSCMGEWIVDSGATHHMIDNPKLFHEYKLSSGNECVSLADGSFTFVAGKWSLSLLNNFLVCGVLHVPHLPLDLLSVSKITKELNCELIFSANRCVLQDLVTGTRIGIGLVSEGLYRLPIHVATALMTAVSRKEKKR
ncbi:hypothetical protein EJ110_NYTH59889 [Nymphaea thermarum]|nr:hypothetical protein EJ110_NYTH59889 [Nymphaea thermarum]